MCVQPLGVSETKDPFIFSSRCRERKKTFLCVASIWSTIITNILRAAFMRTYPKSAKKTINSSSFFALSGSVCAKAVSKHIVEIDLWSTIKTVVVATSMQLRRTFTGHNHRTLPLPSSIGIWVWAYYSQCSKHGRNDLFFISLYSQLPQESSSSINVVKLDFLNCINSNLII